MSRTFESLPGRQSWLTDWRVERQRAALTSVSFEFESVKITEFVAIKGGGSRPLAALRSGRLARPRFTSRFSAGRSVAWRPNGLFRNRRAWMLADSRNSPRASRRRFRRETAHEVGFAEVERPPVASSSAWSHCRATRQDAAPLMGARFADHASWAVSRALARFDARTAPHRCGWAHADACAGAGALHTPSRVFQTAPWCAGAETHPSNACTALHGHERARASWAKSRALGQLGLPILRRREVWD